MLELYVAPQLEGFRPWIIFQQDGAPPHWGSEGSSVFGCFISQTGGLEEIVRHPGHHDRRILPP